MRNFVDRNLNYCVDLVFSIKHVVCWRSPLDLCPHQSMLLSSVSCQHCAYTRLDCSTNLWNSQLTLVCPITLSQKSTGKHKQIPYTTKVRVSHFGSSPAKLNLWFLAALAWAEALHFGVAASVGRWMPECQSVLCPIRDGSPAAISLAMQMRGQRCRTCHSEPCLPSTSLNQRAAACATEE